MKQKILYIRKQPDNPYGGIANYCESLRTMFATDDSLQPLAVENYPCVRARLFHYYYKWRPLWRAVKGADIVHVNGYTELGSAQALALARCLGRRTVYTAHWHPFQYLRHPRGGRLFFRLVMQPAIRLFADVVTTINDEDTRFFSRFHRHVVQIPHCSDPRSSQQPCERQPRQLLFVGRLTDPMKGFDHLYHLPEGQYDIHCVGNGDPAWRSDFTRHSNIPPSELTRLYSESALLVIPSKYEAFSYAALEALSCGTPVVMSDRVRIADYLQGVSGVTVFRYGDYAGFARAVAATIGATVDRQRVAHTFDPQLIRRRYKNEVYLNRHD